MKTAVLACVVVAARGLVPPRVKTLEEQAAQCLEEGCPIDTVETLVNELETAARTLSGQGKSHRYVDELISLLSTSQGMPVSKPPLSSLSAPFVVSPAKVLS